MASKSLFTQLSYGLTKYKGNGFISGTLRVDGNVAQRRVALLRRGSAVAVYSRISKPDGSFLFPYLAQEWVFDVVAYDSNGQYANDNASYVHPYPSSGSPPSWPHGTYVPPLGNDVQLDLSLYAPTYKIAVAHAFTG